MNHLLPEAVTAAQALLLAPLAASALALLLALAALILARPARRSLQAAHQGADRFRKSERKRLERLDGKLIEYEAATRQQTAKPARETPEPPAPDPPQTLPQALPQADSEPAQRKPDPLEEDRALLTAFLHDLLASLDRWAQLAGFDLETVTGFPAEIARLLHAIQPPADDETLNTMTYTQLPPLVRETVKVMLSKTDRDMDPERTNDPLQQHIAQFIRSAMHGKFSVIDPAEGDPLIPQEHNSLGPLPGGTAEQRGSVARTRVRGLRWSGQVVVKAEVLEYD